MLFDAEYDIEADVETRAPYSPDYSYSSEDTEHEAVIPIHLLIKTLDESHDLFGLSMDSSLDTIAMLRRHPAMTTRFGDKASTVKLLYAGKTLTDSMTLENVGVPGSEGMIYALGRKVRASRVGPTASGGSSSSNTGKRKIDVITKNVMTNTTVEIFIHARGDRLIHLEMDSLNDRMDKVRTHHKLVHHLRDWANRCRFTFQGRILKEEDTLASVGVALYGSWIYAVP